MSCFFGCKRFHEYYENGIRYRKCKSCGTIFFERKISEWVKLPKKK